MSFKEFVTNESHGVTGDASDLAKQIAVIAMKIVKLKSDAKNDEKVLGHLRKAEGGLDTAVSELTTVSKMK